MHAQRQLDEVLSAQPHRAGPLPHPVVGHLRHRDLGDRLRRARSQPVHPLEQLRLAVRQLDAMHAAGGEDYATSLRTEMATLGIEP